MPMSCHMQARAALARCQQDAALAAASNLGRAGDIFWASPQPVYVPATIEGRALICHNALEQCGCWHVTVFCCCSQRGSLHLHAFQRRTTWCRRQCAAGRWARSSTGPGDCPARRSAAERFARTQGHGLTVEWNASIKQQHEMKRK